MELSTEKKDRILAKLGLAAVMHTSPGNPAFFNTEIMYDRWIFQIYKSQEYLNSAIRETDEVYRFSNIILLHKETALRLEYAVSEDYYGEDEYSLIKIFIITANRENLVVQDVDFDKKIVITEKGEFSFQDLKRYEPGD